MLNIGNITFQETKNYGAVLQTYALQQTINTIENVKFETLNYISKAVREREKTATLKDIRGIKDLIKFCVMNRNQVQIEEKFRLFASKYLKLSEETYDENNIGNANYEYDMFIAGSDQIWNHSLTGFDKAFFLDFVDKKIYKGSYAPSFGIDKIQKEYIDDYKALLCRFDYMTVREEKGAEILRDLLDIKVPVVLDPTLLLDKMKWSELSIEYHSEQPYVLYYPMNYSKSLYDFAHSLAKKNRCKLIVVNGTIKEIFKGTTIGNCGPQEWLGLIKDAKYVVTNSFHGTAFSINFNKNFFVGMLPPQQKTNSRLENIIKMFGLQSRIVTDEKNNVYKGNIDYDVVNKVLEKERLISVGHIENLINQKFNVRGMNSKINTVRAW